jgi:hypothetical protein
MIVQKGASAGKKLVVTQTLTAQIVETNARAHARRPVIFSKRHIVTRVCVLFVGGIVNSIPGVFVVIFMIRIHGHGLPLLLWSPRCLLFRLLLGPLLLLLG